MITAKEAREKAANVKYIVPVYIMQRIEEAVSQGLFSLVLFYDNKEFYKQNLTHLGFTVSVKDFEYKKDKVMWEYTISW